MANPFLAATPPTFDRHQNSGARWQAPLESQKNTFFSIVQEQKDQQWVA